MTSFCRLNTGAVCGPRSKSTFESAPRVKRLPTPAPNNIKKIL